LIQEIPIDVLSPQKEPGKALELLQRLLGTKDKRIEKAPEAAANICACLEYLPLGIDLVGGYLVKDPELSLPIMLQRLQELKLAEEALQNRETFNLTQLGVKAALTLTWLELDPLTQQLGEFLSLFSPQSILWDLVEKAAIGDEQTATDEEGKEQKQEERQLNWSAQELNEARKQLYERNLLQKVEETEGYYKIHSLVRWFLQGQLAESGEMQSVLERTFAIAMIAIAQNIPNLPTSKEIEFFKATIPHLEDLGRRLIAEVRKKNQEQINSPASVLKEEVIWVFVGVKRFYEGQGLYKLAEPWSEDCLDVCQVLFAGDHPHVAMSLNNLAALYSSQGRYSEAEPLYNQALAMDQRLYEGDHPHVAMSLNNLAELYSSQGRYSEAEPLYNQALAMDQRLYEGDHPDVAMSLNNLAELYRSQGRYSEAEPLYNQALAMCERVLGGNHPTTAMVRENLTALQRQRTPLGILMRWLGNLVKGATPKNFIVLILLSYNVSFLTAW
jgi:tetratricopeptide (TPR) repeat protein